MQAPLPQAALSYARTWSLPTGSEVHVGVAEADITPQDLLYLGGFGIARIATAVHAPLKVRALVLGTGDQRVAIVGIDNLGLQRQDADWIKGGIAGIPMGQVFLAASHTHAGPDLIGMWGRYFLTSGRDRDYLTQVRRSVAAAVAAATARAQPARLAHAIARLPEEGLVRNANRRGVFDRDLHVVHATATADGAPVGTLLHLACHPEVLSRHRTELSPDFVGALCDGWRARGLGQAVFVNGALGAMVSPGVQERDGAGADAMGQALCALAARALPGARALAIDSVAVRRRDLFLPMASLGLVFGKQTTVIPRPTHRGYLRSTVGYLSLGALEIVCVPGEMEPGLAERLRRTSARPGLLVFGLVDDEVGYLMAARDARNPEFEYERTMSPSVDAGERVLRALLAGD
jgi:hypothetical protein